MVNLTAQDTARLIAKMRALYGRKFDQQWQGVDPQTLAQTFADGLQGLTAAELACGVNALMRHDWPPTVPEFRRMCQPVDPLDREWPTPEQAWATAIQNTDEMTTFATCDQIQQAWGVAAAVWPDKYAARKAFCDTYDKIVTGAKVMGRLPVWWMSYGHEKAENRALAVEQAVSGGLVGVGFKSDAVAMLEGAKPAIAPNIAAHLQNLKSMFGMDGETLAEKQLRMEQERKARADQLVMSLAQREAERENWPDPFDQPVEYAKAMRAAGRTIPLCLMTEAEQAAQVAERREAEVQV